MKRSLDDERIQRDELANQAMKQLTDKNLFTRYYHDQVALAQDEAKVYQLPTSFVQRLLTLNQTRSITNQLQHLLIGHVELFEILKFFEISMQLVGEETLLNAFNEQSIQNCISDQSIIGHNVFYTLVLIEESTSFALIPPNTTMTNEDEFTFECNGDAWIETNLMNLIELLVSSTIISRIDNIEQLINCYNRVIQSILSLNTYTEQTKNVFENACSLGEFNTTFENCNAIHEFIEYLRNLFVDSESTTDNVLLHRHRTLLKLEMEFLKN
ncbi:unnamed protein product [Rotaria magnacalcarata]|uniref:Uncharacterized protein n=1 Tax=Rotaria magnacalcarata TaxID=392030 RepID=A0A816H688_9BILA|nr:unnamed protein product [Rotaria magnacalcarata]